MDIFSAARIGNFDMIKKILDHGGLDINTKNENGHSVLMLAAYNGHEEIVRQLIDQGADVNSVDNSGNSILMGVIFKGHSHIFDLLIQSGAQLDYVNPKKQSALDLAVMFGRRNLIFRINQLQNSNRSDSKIEQIKTWVKQAL